MREMVTKPKEESQWEFRKKRKWINRRTTIKNFNEQGETSGKKIDGNRPKIISISKNLDFENDLFNTKKNLATNLNRENYFNNIDYISNVKTMVEII